MFFSIRTKLLNFIAASPTLQLLFYGFYGNSIICLQTELCMWVRHVKIDIRC